MTDSVLPALLTQQAPAIHHLLVRCGRHAVEQSQQLAFNVYEKGHQDYVTTVDRALDRELTLGLRQLFPAATIISEENAASRSHFHQGHDRLWLIDPIDGTLDFIERRPHYALMMGCLENYQAMAGWVYAPHDQRYYCGGSDWGLFQASQSQPLQPLIPQLPAAWDSDRATILLGHTDQENFGAAIHQAIPHLRFYNIGSFGLKVVEVIQGRAGMYVYLNRRVKLWDTVGPIALAQAAGLVCCDLQGNAIRFDPGSVDLEALAHRQPILIGWPSYIQAFRAKLQRAIAAAEGTTP